MTLYMISVINIFMFVVILQAILMLAATDYLDNTEAFYGNTRLSYLRFIKINFQKMLKSLFIKTSYRLSYLAFCSNMILLFLLTVPVMLVFLSSLGFDVGVSPETLRQINSYYVLYATALLLVGRLVSYISSGLKIDINKMVLKGFVSVALIFLNFSFVNFCIERLDDFLHYKIVLKILLFSNNIVSLYVFDSLTKFKKKQSLYQVKLVDKVSMYFLLMGVFFMLNNNIVTNTLSKYVYYSISVFLIDFIVTYVSKLFGHIKMQQTVKVIYSYVFVYYLLFYLTVFWVRYGI